MKMSNFKQMCAALVLSYAASGSVASPLLQVPADMHEAVIKVPSMKPGVDLVVTVFKPSGAGPFPLLVMNHGSDQEKGVDTQGLAQAKPQRHYWLARAFVERGYMVASPMRQGVAGSGGVFNASACNIGDNGVAHGQDIAATLRYFAMQTNVDNKQMVVAGQSHGGLATLGLLASGGDEAKRVKAAIVFSGGLFHASPSCPWTPTRLTKAMSDYGSKIKLPSLWLYAPNDTRFDPPLVAQMLKSFVDAGGNAQFISVLPPGKVDIGGHAFVRWRSSVAQWWPLVQSYLHSQGLPTAQRYSVDELYPVKASGFASIGEVSKVPTSGEGKSRYAQFLAMPSPRAFVIGPKGDSYMGAIEAGAASVALSACQSKSKSACKVYAVDETVVYAP